MSEISSNSDYQQALADIKQRVRHAQTRAILAVNAELIRLYWELGALIDAHQKQKGWGAGVIPQLARDLRNELPEEKGFSERNIKRMLAFYREYSHLEFVPQAEVQKDLTQISQPDTQVPQAVALFPVALIASVPWGHHAELMSKVKDLNTRQWYMQVCVGQGFAFVGRQYHLDIGDQDFYIDLLFYHLQLRCYVVIDLKRGDFKPEYAGKMNFYCSVVDDKLRHETDKPTIGLILCQQPNRVLAEYALRGMDKPIGVSSFELTRALPQTLQSSLPSIEDIERELDLGGNAE